MGLHKIQVSEWGQILADAKGDTDNSKRLDEIFIQVFLYYHARLSNSYGCYLYCDFSLILTGWTLQYQLPCSDITIVSWNSAWIF